ncbi:MAG: zf-HC2 domain-containing protein [Desulfobacteraceae bacterium]|jgi:hypothetical protein
MRNRCPNEETLTDFVEGRLSGRQQARIESHLAACDDCREQVGVYIQLIHPESAAEPVIAPDYLTDKAARLAAGQADAESSRPLFHGARRLAARGIALLEQLGPGNGLQPAPVRGTETTLSEQRISRQKQFDDLTVTIEIERSDDDLALIRVLPAGKAVDQPVRVALIQDDREIASMALAAGPLVFEDIAFGNYTLVFIRSGATLGEYRFKITADDGDAT